MFLASGRGRRRAHKLTPAVMAYVQAARAGEPPPSTAALVQQIAERFGVTVHQRSSANMAATWRLVVQPGHRRARAAGQVHHDHEARRRVPPRPAGGGWGDPLERDPALVLRDVHNELVSLAAARVDYGVVLDPATWTVDAAATGPPRGPARAARTARSARRVALNLDSPVADSYAAAIRPRREDSTEEPMKRASFAVISIVLLAAATLGAVAVAQDLPRLNVKAIGLNSNTVASDIDEKTFWTKTVPEASKGQITADWVPVDQSGIKDFQIARIAKLGVTDFAASDISKLAGDDPRFEGCDLAGLALDIETARNACEAWKPVMGRSMERFGARLLSIGTNPPQVFWCRMPVNGLADLRGKKVRVFNKTMTDFIQAVGGTTVTLPFGEVVPALQRGVVDCAVTGTLSGNTAGWPEVTSHIYPLYMGWSINAESVSLPSWNKWGGPVQKFFLEQFARLEDQMWKTGAEATAEADNCNVGKDPCKLGKKAKMTIVPVSEADKKLHRELMESVVLLNFGKRCGKDCAREWNETVGKVVNLRIPIEKI